MASHHLAVAPQVNRLARVEVQCVMRILDAASLLRFARTSKRMYEDADSPHAWCDDATLELTWTLKQLLQQQRELALALSSSSSPSSPPLLLRDLNLHTRLLRHATISVRCQLHVVRTRDIYTGNFAAEELEEAEVDSEDLTQRGSDAMLHLLRTKELKRVRRILIIGTHYYSQVHWSAFLSLACDAQTLQHIGTIHFAGAEWNLTDATSGLVNLPRLTSLRLPIRVHTDALAALPKLANLTALSVGDDSIEAQPDYVPCLPAVSECRGLKSLTLKSPLMSDVTLCAFFVDAKYFAQIHTLTLCRISILLKPKRDGIPLPVVAVDEYTRAMESLPALTSLRFIHARVQGLFAAAHHAPLLRDIQFVFDTHEIPLLPALDILFALSPRFHVTIRMIYSSYPPPANHPKQMAQYQRRKNVTVEYRALVMQFYHQIGERICERWVGGVKQQEGIDPETILPRALDD